jgi:predicted DNA-binding transcriptional regulator AlpA
VTRQPLTGASVIAFPRAVVRESWLSKRQIADYFGRSTRWVELRVREGLPSKMIGGRRGFRLSEVEAWIDRRDR